MTRLPEFPELPDAPDELQSLLAAEIAALRDSLAAEIQGRKQLIVLQQALADADALIAEAQQNQAEITLARASQLRERILSQSARLQATLPDTLQREPEAIAASTPGPESAPAPGTESPATQEQEEAIEHAVPPATVPAVADDDEDGEPDPEQERHDLHECLADLDVLEERLNDLDRNQDLVAPFELWLDAQELVARIGLLQDNVKWYLVYPRWRDIKDRIDSLFRRTTAIVGTRLTPHRMFVDGLKRNVHHDFQAILDRVQSEREAYLEECERRSRAEEQRRRQEAEEERKREEAEALLPRIRMLVKNAMEGSFSPVDEDDLRTCVESYLELTDPDPELVELLLPVEIVFSEGPFRGLRKKFAKRRGNAMSSAASEVLEAVPDVDAADVDVSDDDDADDGEEEGEDDLYRNFFAGKRGVLLGGDVREPHRQKLIAYFGFDELEWPDSRENSSNLNARLRTKIANHAWDVVFLNVRFMRHAMSGLNKDCKDAGVEHAMLTRGYSLTRFKEAIAEQILPAREQRNGAATAD